MSPILVSIELIAERKILTETPSILLTFVKRASDWMISTLAVLVLVMMVAIAVQVVASRMGLNTIVVWEQSVFLFGKGITLNSLIELHWYLLAAVILFPMPILWARGGHVRVDFVYRAIGSRGRAAIDLLGNFVFTLPFLIMSIPAAWDVTLIALKRGERSTDDGLLDRFLVKGMIPIAFSMLLIVVVFELLPLCKQLFRQEGQN